MRIKYIIYFLFFVLTASSGPAFAQEISLNNIQNLKVEQASDEDITKYWEKLQDSGLSEQEAYKLMAAQGVAPDQIQAFKDRVALLGLKNKTSKTSTKIVEKKTEDYTRNVNDTVIKPQPLPQQTRPGLTVFGTDFFTQSAVKFEPNSTMATPKGYVLGPGDEVLVLVTGLNETVVRTKVSPDGNIQIPNAGLVYVNGFTIEQATTLIKNKLAKVYPALNSGQTRLDVNLGNTRSIKITIVGEVKTPGSYTLSSLSTFFNALYPSGGPTANGSLRNIRLIRNNKVYKIVDFYTFLLNGLQDGNIRLEDQDVIDIPVYTKRVAITGEVKRPAIYELKDNEKLSDLITYAAGYTDIAYKGNARIDQIGTIEREVRTVPANLFENYTPRNGDKVQIDAITNRYSNRIVLEGSVYNPGPFELTAGLTLSQLLKIAQGLRPDAYTELGYIKRTLPNLDKVQISFNPTDVIAGKTDYPLMREDSVIILGRDIFVTNQKVIIRGFVKNQTVLTYRKGLKLTDAIAIAGGFADEAAEHRVEVSRVIENETDSVANQLVRNIIVDMQSTTDPNREMELKPLDVVNVPRLPNYHTLGTIKIEGEVVSPGDFAVQKRDETAIELLQRAGGVTPYGSLENTQIYRNGTRVNLKLSSNMSNEDKKTMILLPGDSIYVPRVISYVEIAGSVNNPQYISYNGRRFKYYINAVGGVTENARLKGAYIKYPDGLSKPVRHFLFFRNYPIVKPGSKIVVPEKSPSKIKIGIGDLGGIAAALTALVSIIAILSKK
ncbi:SLBB domain-containing protein [Mucilaginibacter puniceus]